MTNDSTDHDCWGASYGASSRTPSRASTRARPLSRSWTRCSVSWRSRNSANAQARRCGRGPRRSASPRGPAASPGSRQQGTARAP